MISIWGKGKHDKGAVLTLFWILINVCHLTRTTTNKIFSPLFLHHSGLQFSSPPLFCPLLLYLLAGPYSGPSPSDAIVHDWIAEWPNWVIGRMAKCCHFPIDRSELINANCFLLHHWGGQHKLSNKRYSSPASRRVGEKTALHASRGMRESAQLKHTE